MTREEAIDYNKNLRMYMKLSDKNQPCKFLEENYIALDMAIKALEQEPCGDCISRKAVLAIAGDSCLDLNSYEDTKEFCDEIKDLPPVTPQPKTDVLDKIRAEIENTYKSESEVEK